MAREDRPGDKKLVAYLVLVPDSKLVSIEIRKALKEKLPSYMVPSAIIILPFLPLTPNGKVISHFLFFTIFFSWLEMNYQFLRLKIWLCRNL